MKIFISLVLIVISFAAARGQLGMHRAKVISDGEKVVLKSDGTWDVAGAPSSMEKTIEPTVVDGKFPARFAGDNPFILTDYLSTLEAARPKSRLEDINDYLARVERFVTETKLPGSNRRLEEFVLVVSPNGKILLVASNIMITATLLILTLPITSSFNASRKTRSLTATRLVLPSAAIYFEEHI